MSGSFTWELLCQNMPSMVMIITMAPFLEMSPPSALTNILASCPVLSPVGGKCQLMEQQPTPSSSVKSLYSSSSEVAWRTTCRTQILRSFSFMSLQVLMDISCSARPATVLSLCCSAATTI